jgi:glycosyltransferase involved in cell wall biosynthesis
MTVAEALRCEKPVISTRCGGPEEFLNEGNSIIINPKNNHELVKCNFENGE